MLSKHHTNPRTQRVIGLIIGVAFGFLLQKGGLTSYDVIVGQLLLTDFTVAKVMLSAIVTGMLGVHLLRDLGLVRLHPKPGSVGSSVVGGLIFGVGFAILGYCPGTVASAVGQGSLDGLFGGVVGMLIGTALFAAGYPRLQKSILSKGDFGAVTLPDLLNANAWIVVIPAAILLTGLLVWMERVGL